MPADDVVRVECALEACSVGSPVNASVPLSHPDNMLLRVAALRDDAALLFVCLFVCRL